MPDLSLAPAPSAATPAATPTTVATPPAANSLATKPAAGIVDDSDTTRPASTPAKVTAAGAATTSDSPGAGMIPAGLLPDDTSYQASSLPSIDRTLQPLPTVTRTGLAPAGTESSLSDQLSEAAMSVEAKAGVSIGTLSESTARDQLKGLRSVGATLIIGFVIYYVRRRRRRRRQEDAAARPVSRV